MDTVSSKDGTTIAFDKSGQGPALILVPGAFEQRAMQTETANLARLPLLGQHFTVHHYDRRGRGDSTDTLPYALERELEDIEALIDHARPASRIKAERAERQKRVTSRRRRKPADEESPIAATPKPKVDQPPVGPA
jgi:hypothetical protein